MPVNYLVAEAGFHVGQQGEFVLYDAFHRPIETVRGKIHSLMEGDGALYAMLRTDDGIRPARLAILPPREEPGNGVYRYAERA